MKVIKRDGKAVDYNREKIEIAIEKANKEAEKMLNSMQEMIDKLREMHECIGVENTKKENFQDDFRKWLYSQEGDSNADL